MWACYPKPLCPSFLKRKHYCRFLGNIEKVYPLMYMKWRKRMTCSFPPFFLENAGELHIIIFRRKRGKNAYSTTHTSNALIGSYNMCATKTLRPTTNSSTDKLTFRRR
jgi:hypothetical protein